MILKKFVVGPLETNCYVFGDEVAGEVAVIDPGGDPAPIKKYIEKNGLKVKCVINTHGHGDHIGANAMFDAPVLIHKLDKDFLTSPALNMSSAFGAHISVPEANRILNDGDRIEIGGYKLEVLHTPGHTPGSISLRYENTVFTGDTLFFEGVGRTDLPDGSWEALITSIGTKLLSLPDDCRVYPGHGSHTTIGHERKNNHFLQLI